MKLKKFALPSLAVAALVLSTSFGLVSSAKTVVKTTTKTKKTSYSLHAKKSTKAASYKNLSNGSSINKRGAKAPAAPANKGGKKGRGATYELHIDNHSAYYADVYVGGVYAGTVAPYGDIWPVIYSGSTTVRAISTFDDGSTLDWGPYSAESYGSTLTLGLYS